MKSRNRFVPIVILATLFTTSTAQAQEKKKARSNDTVSEYSLTYTGTLNRHMERYGARPDNNPYNDVICAVTTRVSDFKISQHPNDAALAYFIKDGELHYVKSSGRTQGTNCPPAETKLIARPVSMSEGKYVYGVISNTQTQYVNYVLTTDREFAAWKNTGQPLEVRNVVEVKQNSCYGASGQLDFKRKILFLRKADGTILAMEEDGKTTDQGRYSSIAAFKNDSGKNVCKAQRNRGGARFASESTTEATSATSGL
jgi:hypothetical protein